MINLKFGLFWSGTKLSYLRYLTFLTLRYHHPDASIELYVSDSCRKDGLKWAEEEQDFQTDEEGEDWLEKLTDLNVSIVKTNIFPDFAPNFQSDLFRWWWLQKEGGFYLDTDQIILRSFNGLPLESDFIFSMYDAESCGRYAPVGVLGASPSSKMVRYVKNHIMDYYNPDVYNSIGPFMLRDVAERIQKSPYVDGEILFNAPSCYFYPLSESYMVSKLFNEQVDFGISQSSYALHWFGGSPVSQRFNRSYTEEDARNNNDKISEIIRNMGVLG